MQNGYKDGFDTLKDSVKFGVGYYALLTALAYSTEKKLKALPKDNKVDEYFALTPQERALHFIDDALETDYNLKFLVMDNVPSGNKKWDEYYQSFVDKYRKEQRSLEEMLDESTKYIIKLFAPSYFRKNILNVQMKRKKPDMLWHLPAPSDNASEEAKLIFTYLADKLEKKNEEWKNLPFNEKEYNKHWADMGKRMEEDYDAYIKEREIWYSKYPF